MTGGRGAILGVSAGEGLTFPAGLVLVGLGVGAGVVVGLSVEAGVGTGLGLGVGVGVLTFIFTFVLKPVSTLEFVLKFESVLKLKFESKPRFVFKLMF